MQASQWRYALRAMQHLAGRPLKSMGARALAHAADGDEKFMYAILRRLVAAGLLRSARGRVGGYRLARPPDQITVFDVVGAIDPRRAVSACGAYGARKACKGCAAYCLIKRTLDDAEAAFFNVLRTRTLTDLAKMAEGGELTR